jgi:hypothetical protein
MKLNNLTDRVAKLIYERTARVEVVPFTEVRRSLETCLILMPGRLEMIKPAAEILPEIAASLPNRSHKIMLSSSIDPQSHDIIKKFIVIRAEPFDFDTFSLPKKHFIKKISTGGVGIVIDLDIKPNLFNAVVGLRCGAPVRTTFDKGVGLPYYNMVVGPSDPDKDPRAAYRAMADILSNFSL